MLGHEAYCVLGEVLQFLRVSGLSLVSVYSTWCSGKSAILNGRGNILLTTITDAEVELRENMRFLFFRLSVRKRDGRRLNF